MALSQFFNATSQIFGHINVPSTTISEILIFLGLAIGFIVIVSAIGYGMFKLARVLPSMSVKQFMIFLLLLAVCLVVIGILLP